MKKAIFVVVILACLFIINNLVRSIYNLWQKKDLVAKAEKQLTHQKEENKKLKSQILYAQSNEFIEKEARDKLFMVKEGEQQVLIPKATIRESIVNDKGIESKPNWKKWWELFF